MADKDFRVKRGIHVGTDAYIGNSITSVNSVSFLTTEEFEPSRGSLAWSNSDGTLSLGVAADVRLQLGQETHYYVLNQTGSTILNNTVVMANGTVGNSGTILVSPAIGDGTFPSKYVMGIATQDIPDGELGYVTAFGKVRGINTSMFSEGDILFLDPGVPGAMMNTAPVAPNNRVTVAIVVTKSENVGEIFVRPTFTDRVSELEDVFINGISDGQTIAWVSANSRFENQTISGGGASLNVALANSSNIATNVVSGVSTLLFDTDSGLDIVNLGGGNVKVQLNSTFKTWEVDGQESLIAEGLDNVRFVAGDGISITTNALASPKSIEFAWNANSWVNANDYTTYTTLNSRINTVQSNVTSISADGIINSETFTTVSTSNTFSLYTTVGDANNIIVSLSGIVQYPTLDYVVAGSTLTLSNVAPITGGLVLEVRYLNTRGRGSDDAVLFSDSFAVDGSTNAFTLSGAVSNKTSLLVYFDGLLQHDDTYETSGNTLTIANSAPLQTSKLSVRALNGGSSGGGGGAADTSDVANLAFALSIFFS